MHGVGMKQRKDVKKPAVQQKTSDVDDPVIIYENS